MIKFKKILSNLKIELLVRHPFNYAAKMFVENPEAFYKEDEKLELLEKSLLLSGFDFILDRIKPEPENEIACKRTGLMRRDRATLRLKFGHVTSVEIISLRTVQNELICQGRKYVKEPVTFYICDHTLSPYPLIFTNSPYAQSSQNPQKFLCKRFQDTGYKSITGIDLLKMYNQGLL